MKLRVEDLIVSAESIDTGERLYGYVCGCESCSKSLDGENYDRPIGLITHPEGLYGNVAVYTDTMKLIHYDRIKKLEKLEEDYNSFIKTEDGKEYIKTQKEPYEFWDFIHDFHTEMLNL